MQAADLKNPGIDQLSQQLRLLAAKAISNAEQETNPSGALKEFFADCAAKAPGVAPEPVPEE